MGLLPIALLTGVLRPRVLLVLAALALPIGTTAAENPRMGPDIYDSRADGQVLISATLTRARGEKVRAAQPRYQRVSLVPPVAHIVHHRSRRSPGARVQLRFGDGHLNTRHDPQRNAAVTARSRNPLRHGAPVFIVLDAAGHRLATLSPAGLPDEQGQPLARLVDLSAQWAPAR